MEIALGICYPQERFSLLLRGTDLSNSASFSKGHYIGHSINSTSSLFRQNTDLLVKLDLSLKLQVSSTRKKCMFTYHIERKFILGFSCALGLKSVFSYVELLSTRFSFSFLLLPNRANFRLI